MRYAIAASCVAVILVVAGCATGPRFTSPIEPPADEAVVYFYRPYQYAASAVAPALRDNGKKITRLMTNGYYEYIVKPGKHEFVTDTMSIDKALSLKLEAGKTYYVRLEPISGMWTMSWRLSYVFPEQGLSEIKSCKRIE